MPVYRGGQCIPPSRPLQSNNAQAKAWNDQIHPHLTPETDNYDGHHGSTSNKKTLEKRPSSGAKVHFADSVSINGQQRDTVKGNSHKALKSGGSLSLTLGSSHRRSAGNKNFRGKFSDYNSPSSTNYIGTGIHGTLRNG